MDTFSLPTIGNPSSAVLLLIVFPVSAKVTFAVMVSSKILSKYSTVEKTRPDGHESAHDNDVD